MGLPRRISVSGQLAGREQKFRERCARETINKRHYGRVISAREAPFCQLAVAQSVDLHPRVEASRRQVVTLDHVESPLKAVR